MADDQLAKMAQALSIKQEAKTEKPKAKGKRHVRPVSGMEALLAQLKDVAQRQAEKECLGILGELIEIVTPTSSAPYCDSIAAVAWSGELLVDLLRPTHSRAIQEKTAELLGYLSTHEKCSLSIAKAGISEVATPVLLEHVKHMTEEKPPADNLTRELLEALVNIVVLQENSESLTQTPLFLHSLVSTVETSLKVASKQPALPEGFARQHHSMTYALHCLSNFANCERSCAFLVHAHAIPVLMDVVNTGPFHVRPIALSCLMNLCVGQREAVTAAGALVSVMAILKEANGEAPQAQASSSSGNAKKKNKKGKEKALPADVAPESDTIEAALKLFCNLVEEHPQNAALARAMGTTPLLSGWLLKDVVLKGDQPITKEIKDLAVKVLVYLGTGGTADSAENAVSATCTPACFGCGKAEAPSKSLQLCGRCGVAKYCSRECQVSHWKSHKADCVGKA